jgi:hypothetical protein
MRLRPFAALGLLLLIGCAQSGAVLPSNAESIAPLASPTAAELDAMRFRSDFGLRSDLEFVRQVALDPQASSREFAVPLLPTEVSELFAREANAETALAIVAAEASAHPEDYCGRYVDNADGGAVTTLWRANLETHERAIRSKLSPLARLAFLSCRFSQRELDALMERLNADDRSWMAAIPAKATSWGRNDTEDLIELHISSTTPDAAAVVLNHYVTVLGLPEGILRVESDGNGAALRPWGFVRVTVIGPNGRVVGPNSLGLDWQGDLPTLYCGVGDKGYGISWDGTPSELPCQAGRWTIYVGTAGRESAVGHGEVTVIGGKTATLTIRVSSVPSAPP